MIKKLTAQSNPEVLALQQAQAAAAVSVASPSQQGAQIQGIDPINLGGVAAPKPNETVRWNALARDLVAKTKTVPPLASRIYSVLSEVQYEVLKAADSAGAQINPKRALREASIAALKALFPDEAAAITADAKKDAPGRSVPGQGSSTLSRKLGQQIAKVVVERRAGDGHLNKKGVVLPEPGPGVWQSAANPPALPLLPIWGETRPVFMPQLGEKGRPQCPNPPALNSAEFKRDLAEVRQISDTRTAEQTAIAMKWAANLGTATPPGMWNEIASTLITQYKLNDRDAAQIMHYLNGAVMDAGIGCWEVKYQHWLARPTMVDPQITIPEGLGLPNFPSYTSGHATFSGAAARVLGHFFKKDADRLKQMADEAAMSRVYGGIHYRFDGTRGVEHGEKIADLAIRALRDEQKILG